MSAADFFLQQAGGAVAPDDRARGLANYHAGLAAEDLIARDYARRGHAVLARRWRGQAGELDLVCADGDGIIVVEVKKARSLEAAALRISRRQAERIGQSACDYAGQMPAGLLTPIRIDAALVDGQGRQKIIENVTLEG